MHVRPMFPNQPWPFGLQAYPSLSWVTLTMWAGGGIRRQPSLSSVKPYLCHWCCFTDIQILYTFFFSLLLMQLMDPGHLDTH